MLDCSLLFHLIKHRVSYILVIGNDRYERFIVALEEASRDMLPTLKDRALKVGDPALSCAMQFLVYMNIARHFCLCHVIYVDCLSKVLRRLYSAHVVFWTRLVYLFVVGPFCLTLKY